MASQVANEIFSDWNCDVGDIEDNIKQNLMVLVDEIKSSATWHFYSYSDDDEPHIYVSFGGLDELTEYVDLNISHEKFREIIDFQLSSSSHPDDLRLLLDGVRKWGDVIKQAEAKILAIAKVDT